jgi:HNH endonuclease/AP2 domain
MRPRTIRLEGDVAYVPLTKSYEAVIDAADASLVEGWNWIAVVQSRRVYAARTDRADNQRRDIRMHRVLMGEPDGFDVDHINGDGLDNRRANLRIATRAENLRNQRLSLRNTSGFKGVCWDKDKGKWRAQIKLNWGNHYLGLYTTPEEAHQAYVAASIKIHGEFGRIA